MPKVNVNRDAPLNAAAQKVYQYFQAGLAEKQICRIMGYDRSTHYRRMKRPEQFTLAELRILYREAKLPDEVFMRMIREDPSEKRHN